MLGNLHVDWFTEDFDRQMKEGSGICAPLMGALQGEPVGGFIYCGLFETVKRACLLWTFKDMQRKAMELGTSHHRGTIGKPEGGSFTRVSVRWTKKDYGSGVSSMGALQEEPEGRTPLLGTLKDM